MSDLSLVPFKISAAEIERLRIISRPDDGLHLIHRFSRHPGYSGFARDIDGTGFALFQPDDSQLEALFAQMMQTSPGNDTPTETDRGLIE